MPMTDTPRSRKPKLTAHSDPLGYANRAHEQEFDEYQAVREHVRKLIAGAQAKAAA